jgi:UMF1 family MFS transporter
MAVEYGLSIGFDSGDLILALLITQFVGFPCAVFFGWLGRRIGPKQGVLLFFVDPGRAKEELQGGVQT